MSRLALCFATGLATLGVGLATALVQAENHARARRLADLQRTWEHLEAINVQREARAASHVFEDGRPAADEAPRGGLPPWSSGRGGMD